MRRRHIRDFTTAVFQQGENKADFYETLYYYAHLTLLPEELLRHLLGHYFYALGARTFLVLRGIILVYCFRSLCWFKK